MNAATTEPFEQDDYDSPWKEAIEHHFPEFMFDCSHAPLAVVEDIGSLR